VLGSPIRRILKKHHARVTSQISGKMTKVDWQLRQFIAEWCSLIVSYWCTDKRLHQ